MLIFNARKRPRRNGWGLRSKLLFVAGIPSCRGFAFILRRNDTGYMNSCHSYSFLIRSCFCALKYKALRHIVIMAYFT